MDEKQMAETQK